MLNPRILFNKSLILQWFHAYFKISIHFRSQFTFVRGLNHLLKKHNIYRVKCFLQNQKKTLALITGLRFYYLLTNNRLSSALWWCSVQWGKFSVQCTAAATSANFAQQGPDISNKSAARVTISWKQNLNIIHWVSAVLDIETYRRRGEELLSLRLRQPYVLSCCPFQSRYCTALYFCFTGLISVGFGNVAPNTDAEKLYTIALMMLGCKSRVTCHTCHEPRTTPARHTSYLVTTIELLLRPDGWLSDARTANQCKNGGGE